MFTKSIFCFICLLTLTHCGSSKSNQNLQEESPQHRNAGDEQMLKELQTSHPYSVNGIIGSFRFSASSTMASFIVFYENNTYSSGFLQKVSDNYYRIHATIGTYYSKSEYQMGFVKKKTSCHATQNSPTFATASGDIRGSSIVLTDNSATAIFPRVDLSLSNLPSRGVLIEWGCFLNDGLKLMPFVQDQWVNVNP